MEESDSLPGASGVGQMLARARFELVPVKGLEDQADHLPAGATATVTCSPRRGIARTLEACGWLAGRGFRAVPHLCARQISGPAHLDEIVDGLRADAIEEVFVVGGDAREPSGPYRSGLDLLSAMADRGHVFRSIGVAGYPERHPLIDEATLIEALRLKSRFATYIVTQICYEPAAIFRWIEAIRREGIHLPVHIGLPGPLERRKLLEISLRVGVGDSIRYIAKQRNLLARLAFRGGYRPDDFVANVSAGLGDAGSNVVGFHINTFNQVDVAERWRRRALAAYGRSVDPP
jgi:methylenetetrahydrofolate reductase (NADPH)